MVEINRVCMVMVMVMVLTCQVHHCEILIVVQYLSREGEKGGQRGER